MGIDLLEIPIAKTRLDQAAAILGWSVTDICQSDEATLSRTLYTQPCLYVIESILAEVLLAQGQRPDYVAGHSLGEYVALYVAGVFDFETGLHLVQHRAKLMDEAGGGMMVALMKFDRTQLEQHLNRTPDVVIANDNSPAQVVISGSPEAVESVLSQVRARRVVHLQVSGAFHSPLVAPAAAEFEQLLNATPFQPAKVPVLSNVEPEPANHADTLKERLRQQMTGTVRWREIALRFPTVGIDRVIEIGPGKALTGLIKRTCENLILENISCVAELPHHGQKP